MKRILILITALLLLSACGSKASQTASVSDESDGSQWGGAHFGTIAGATLAGEEALPDEEPTREPSMEETAATIREHDSPTHGGITEDTICSYLQGSGSYDKGLEWSGEWCYIDAGKGKMFYSFGCGICCLANMYTTFTGNTIDPGEMYELAKEETSYNPGPSGGAIDWPEIDAICTKYGFEGTLTKKPEEYSVFQQDMTEATTIMVLVSSDEDDVIWQNLPGHYVNLWLYNAEEDTVFMSDSRGPATNRTRVKLHDVYNALLTSESYQYYVIQ